LSVATPFHSLLDSLGRDAFLEKLVGDAVELVGLTHCRHFEQLLLTASVPVSLRLHLVGGHSPIESRGPVFVPLAHRVHFLHLEAIFVANLFLV